MADVASPEAVDRRQKLLELGVLVSLLLPPVLLSFFIKGDHESFFLAGVATILRDLALVALVIYFVWRSSEPLSAIGWVARRPWRDLALGVVLWLPMVFGASLLAILLKAIGLKGPSGTLPSVLAPHTPFEIFFATVMVAVVAISEETIFRGYMILRLTQGTRSRVAAVLLSSLFFAMGHGYEGWSGVIAVGFLGLMLALLYLWTKHLLAPIVAHFLQDFLSIVWLPFVTHK